LASLISTPFALAIVTAKSRNASAWLSAFDMGAACFEDSPLFAAKIMSNPRSVNRNRNHRPELIRRIMVLLCDIGLRGTMNDVTRDLVSALLANRLCRRPVGAWATVYHQ
jgi:hypothetical protein